MVSAHREFIEIPPGERPIRGNFKLAQFELRTWPLDGALHKVLRMAEFTGKPPNTWSEPTKWYPLAYRLLAHPELGKATKFGGWNIIGTRLNGEVHLERAFKHGKGENMQDINQNELEIHLQSKTPTGERLKIWIRVHTIQYATEWHRKHPEYNKDRQTKGYFIKQGK